MISNVGASMVGKVVLWLGLVVGATIASTFCAVHGFWHGLALSSGLSLLLVIPMVVSGSRVIAVVSSARDLATQVRSLTREAIDLEAVANAQENLEQNLNALRDLCYKHGDPRSVSGKLLFGDYSVNGNVEIVDHVQSKHGGAATIFHGPTRVATNIKDQSGSRMVGTALDQGPVFEKLFHQGKTYRGEANIAGVAYITIYEPVVCGAEIVGAIFVAVKKADTTDVQDNVDTLPVKAGISASTERLRTVILDRDAAMRLESEKRGEMTDRRRKQKALERETAAVQANVVSALSAALARLAGSDLTSTIDCAFPEEYQKLKHDFGSATEALRLALTAISTETRAIREGSLEITAAVDDLSRRTEQQAASLEETAASLDQITVGVRQTAGSVDVAHRAVSETRIAAEESTKIMREAVGAMQEIDQSSQKIGQIIGVINEISFQTNLLALNAGVEAARAGDSGRGFAVVAAEVRALAQRSAEAAHEIKTLIETSAQIVARGVTLIGATGSALDTITSRVKGVDETIVKISASTQEQALSLQEINIAITQMDKFTQQNAAMVEESTAASHVLAQQAATLESLVGQFQTGETVMDLANYVPTRHKVSKLRTAMR